MQYMGDLPTKKSPYEQLVYILSTGMYTDEICDEIYAQVLKQLNHNNSPKAYVRKLLHLICIAIKISRM